MNYMKKLSASSLLIALAALPVQAADYVIDTEGAHAFINFKVSHLGYSWVHGRFNQFSGVFSYDAEKPADAKIQIEINTDSVDSNHAERDKHLRNKELLNTSKFPKAEFVSTKIVPKPENKFEVYGNFTLNGVSKEIVILAEKLGEGQDPWGGHRVGFVGNTQLTLKDFGINFDLGPAAKTVDLEFTFEGIRK